MKYVKLFEQFLIENVREIEGLDEIVDFCQALRKQLSRSTQLYIDSMGDVGFDFTARGKRFSFDARPRHHEMAVTHRTGTPYTEVVKYEDDNYPEVAKNLLEKYTAKKIDLNAFRDITVGRKTGIIEKDQ